jgi:Putative amidase domain/Putative peptidoglycan binding domain
MYLGTTGTCVVSLQSWMRLATVHHKNIAVDGYFGQETLAAVKEFQALRGIPVDGRFGKLSRAELRKWYFETKSAPQSRPSNPPGYPADFNPTAAAAWAAEHWDQIDGTDFRGDNVANHCAEFVSAALHRGGGLDYTGSWHPRKTGVELKKQKAYYVTNSLRDWLLSKKTWITPVGLDLGDGLSAAKAGAQPGDIIYYSWDGMNAAHSSHVAIVVQVNGYEVTVVDQGEVVTHNRRYWDISRSQPDKHIRNLEPNSTATLLKWKR